MQKQEIAEIKRRFKGGQDSISTVYGCYVAPGTMDIISDFELGTGLMTVEEEDMYLKTIRKTLSGKQGQTMHMLHFSNEQVETGKEHAFLMNLVKDHLKDKDARNELYQKIMDSVSIENNDNGYVILLASDSYDIPYKGSDGERFDDASDEVFDYFLCCICPVKESKFELGYKAQDKMFRESHIGKIIKAPEIGFLFPSFDDRTTNIYDVMLYCKKTDNTQEEFVQNVFGIGDVPSPSDTKKEKFKRVLEESLDDDCEIPIVTKIINEVAGMEEDAKESETPAVNMASIAKIISEESGVKSEERFLKGMKDEFGSEDEFDPGVILETKKCTIECAGAKINVDPLLMPDIKTDKINGRTYVLIPVSEGLMINGVEVKY